MFLTSIYNFISTVISVHLREGAPQGAHCCMIISVSAWGKYEQKSLRDTKGSQASPGSLLSHFWKALIQYSLCSSPHSLFIQSLPPEYCNIKSIKMFVYARKGFLIFNTDPNTWISRFISLHNYIATSVTTSLLAQRLFCSYSIEHAVFGHQWLLKR